ncbi:MAG: hypothetical protein RLP44_31740 [Aggregatilineales bacterium]
MSAFVFFIEQTAIAWYLFIGAAVVFYLYRWASATSDLRASAFRLERDLAKDRRGGAVMAIFLLIELGLAVNGVRSVVAPSVREDLQMNELMTVQVVDGTFSTPTPPAVLEALDIDSSGIDLGPQDEAVIFITPTLTPTPVGTILPDVDDPSGCETENAMLEIPVNGMRVFQPIEVRGTAFVDNFSQYKLEIGRPGPNDTFIFAQLDVGASPVTEMGNLSQFNPAPFQSEPGMYQMRLMVFDINDVLRASCLVNIEISPPIPTPTPLGG